ncbi:MAG TPA: hypothetical protein VGE13_00085 [Candidatus Saccharimonadales bacterium]
MHDQSPQSGDSNHGLFGQLEGLDAEIVAKEVNDAISDAEYQVESRAYQQIAVEVMVSREETPDQVGEVLDMLKNDPSLEAGDMSTKLFNARRSSLETYPDEARIREAVFDYVWSMGQLLEGSLVKKELQLQVIGDDTLSAHIKQYLLDVIDDLSDEEGIDFSDTDAVSKVLTTLRERKEKEVRWERTRRIFQETGARILRVRYSIHPDDPAWRDLCKAAVTSLIVKKDYELKGMPVDAAVLFRPDEALRILRIPVAVYEDTLERTYDGLDNDWPF